jgi:hypothetical protein
LASGSWAVADLETLLAGGGVVPELEAVRTVVEMAAGRVPGRSQGFLLSPAVKRAVELFAMSCAIAYYSRDWDVVEDVKASRPYDPVPFCFCPPH